MAKRALRRKGPPALELDGLRTTSAPDLVREGLRRAIFSGELVSGMQLRQDELAARFGTSRIPVREALRQLETEGLVKLQQNRGAIVASLSLDEVLEMLDIRIALECRALRLAVPNMVESDFEQARGILRSYDAEPDPASWGDMNWRFHETIYIPCNRPKLLSMIESNYGHVGRFTRVQVSLAAGKERPQSEHWQILKLCEAGASEKAAQLLEAHILHTQKSLKAAARRVSRP